MILDKLPGESKLAYHKRLVYGKLVDKTLADVDYTELSPMVYDGQEYSADVARRMMYGSCRTLQMMDDQPVQAASTDDVIADIQSQRIELQKERQRFSDQRREFNKLVNSQGRWEHLVDRLTDAANRLNEMTPLVGKTMYADDVGDNDAVLVLSDWHYGMKTSNAFNKFNTAICRERVKKVVEMASQRLEMHKCRDLHVFILGDLIHGCTHVSARVQSDELVCDQLMQVTELLAQALFELSQRVSHLYVHMTYGNHARTVQNKNDSVHADNMERIVPWWLKMRFINAGNVEVVDEDYGEFLYANVHGYDFVGTHGDLDSVKSSPRLIPALFNKTYDLNVDYILLGDKHHHESFDELGVRAMIVGSLCGTDDYANEHRLYSDPEQTLLIVNNVGVDAEYHIKL